MHLLRTSESVKKGPCNSALLHQESNARNDSTLKAAPPLGRSMTTSLASARTAGTFQPHKPSKFDPVFCGLEDQTVCKNKFSVFWAMLRKANIPGLCGIWNRSTFLLCTKKKKNRNIKVEEKERKKDLREKKKDAFSSYQSRAKVSESRVQNF